MTKPSTNEDRVLEAVRGRKNSEYSHLVLSNGVELNVQRVPNLLFPEVVKKFPRPKPPMFMNEDMGREEENPNDPTYIDAVNNWNADMSVALVNLMVLMGTTLGSTPKGFSKPEDESWTRKLSVLGIEVGSDPDMRYLMWVKYVAAADPDDVNKLVEAVGRLSGVSEEDVQETMKQFRDNS